MATDIVRYRFSAGTTTVWFGSFDGLAFRPSAMLPGPASNLQRAASHTVSATDSTAVREQQDTETSTSLSVPWRRRADARDMAIHKVTDSGGEPCTWKVTHFANISGSEEFVMQLVMEMPELVDASMIYEPERQKLKEAILAISFDGLMPAFEELKRIRASTNQSIPDLNRRQLYEAFTILLWRSFKDLMQRAAKLMEPEIGFLFQDGPNFEKGLTAWRGKRLIARAVAPYLRKQRTTWQNELGAFRNFLEHKDNTDPGVYEGHYSPAHAETLFETVWRAIADILAMLVSLHLPPGTSLVEMPSEQRNKVMARRFCFAVQGIPPQKDT